MLQIAAYDTTGGGNTFIPLTPGPGSSDSFLTESGSGGSFANVSVTSSGASNAAGGLSTTTLDVSAVSSSVLTLFITQTGLTPVNPLMPFLLTFTLNGLTTADGVGSVVFTDFVDPSNSAYGGTGISGSTTGEQLNAPVTITNSTVASQTLSGVANGLTGPYSETQEIVLNFSTPGTISASSQMKPIPEPATMTLLALPLGLAGLAAMRKRNQA